MISRKDLFFLFVFSFICKVYSAGYKDIKILFGNPVYTYYYPPSQPITCKYRKVQYQCIYSYQKGSAYNATIYNGNVNFPVKPTHSYNIILTQEKLSQVKFMKQIAEGNNPNYQLAVDYRLFSNKWHVSMPYYSDSDFSDFLPTSKRNYNSFSSFRKRRNEIVYIQRVRYRKRHYFVQRIMKYFKVDSYGNDLHNKDWPTDIPKEKKVELLKKYKFCLAIENSVITWNEGNKYEAAAINNDYVTEKLIDCLKAGTIPIYFGPKNVDLFLPHPDAIINLSNFNSIENLTNYIIKVRDNVSLMKKHLKWCNDDNSISKQWYKRFNYDFKFNYCKICNHVYQYSKD